MSLLDDPTQLQDVVGEWLSMPATAFALDMTYRRPGTVRSGLSMDSLVRIGDRAAYHKRGRLVSP